MTLSPVQLDLMQRVTAEAEAALAQIEVIQQDYLSTLNNVATEAGVPAGALVSFDPNAGVLVYEEAA